MRYIRWPPRLNRGTGTLSEAQEINFKTLYFVNKKRFQGQDTSLRKLPVRVAQPAWYEFAVCNCDGAREILFDFSRSPKVMPLLQCSFITHFSATSS